MCSSYAELMDTLLFFSRKSLWEKWTVQMKASYFFQTDKISSVEVRINREKNAELQEETATLIQKLVEV